MPIVNRIADLHSEITAWRRDIHAHPELLFDVHRTAASVAEQGSQPPHLGSPEEPLYAQIAADLINLQSTG